MSAKRVTFAPSAAGPRAAANRAGNLFAGTRPPWGRGGLSSFPREAASMDKQRVHTNPRHYSWLTEQLSPPSPPGAGLGRAFWVGGLICVLGRPLRMQASIGWT